MRNRLLLVGLFLLLTTCPVLAQTPAPPPSPPSSPGPATTKPLEELDALRIEKLQLERALLEEQFRRLQGDYQQKGRDLDAALDAAAKKAGVDRKEGWIPDFAAKSWRKTP